MSNRFNVLSVAASAWSLGLLSASAHAQTEPAERHGGTRLEEIIVTAQKQETSLQTTPMAVSAVSGESLARTQVTSIEGLAQALPSVNFGQTTGNARIAIRGVGFDNLSLGNEGRVAYHTDGVYISRPAAALASFYDVERVEVVRGPQGVLYGRNATAGAVNVILREPGDQLNGYVDGTVGSYGLYRLEGAVGGPLGGDLSGRLSFQVNERDGYGKNLTNGFEVDDLSTQAIRGKIRYQPSETVDLTLSGDYFTQDDHAYSFHYLGYGSLAYPATPTTPALPGAVPKGLRVGGVVPEDPRDSTSDSGPLNDREFWGATATASFQLGGLELVSITGYRSNYFHTVTDLDATSARLSVYDQIEDSEHFSQEFHLAGEYSRGDWMVGAYYFDESLFGGTRVALDRLVLTPNTAPALPAPTSLRQGFYGMGDQDTEAWAVFANVHHRFTDQFAIRAGVRYSDEKKSVDEVLKLDFVTPYPPFVSFFPPTPPGARRQASETWTSTTPSITFEYTVNDDIFLFATYVEGFKSGGFNLGNLQPPFAPEELSAFEVGMRADWLDGKLRTNLTGFYYDYTNLQVSQVQGTAILIQNAAGATVYGVEAELTAIPVERLVLEADISLLHSEYDDFVSADPARPGLGPIDLAGNQLTQAPEYTVNLNASYTVPTSVGDFTMRGEGRWVDTVFLTQYNLEHTSQPAYQLFNAFLTWDGGKGLTATAFIRNIADEEVISAGLISSSLVGSPFVGSFEPPRTYGLSVGYRF